MSEKINSNFFQQCFFNTNHTKARSQKVSLVPLKFLASSDQVQFKENFKSPRVTQGSVILNEICVKQVNEGRNSYARIKEIKDTPESLNRKPMKLPSLKPLLHNKNFSVRSSAALGVLNRKLFVPERNEMEITFSNSIHTPVPQFADFNFVNKE